MELKEILSGRPTQFDAERIGLDSGHVRLHLAPVYRQDELVLHGLPDKSCTGRTRILVCALILH